MPDTIGDNTPLSNFIQAPAAPASTDSPAQESIPGDASPSPLPAPDDSLNIVHALAADEQPVANEVCPSSALAEVSQAIPVDAPSHDEPDPTEPPPLRDTHPLANAQPPQRPGVSNQTLHQNGVTITEPGPNGKWGLKIPYHTFEGGETGRHEMGDGKGGAFYRERMARIDAKPKYRQPAGTPPCAYIPLGVDARLREHRYMIVTEGEFKSLSLGEAGYPAVALGGIYNFRFDGRLLPELFEIFEWTSREFGGCSAIYFLGDADTALNDQFADAVIEFRDCLRATNIHVPLLLPRMPVEDMKARKGIDDAREDMPAAEFGPYMDGLLTNAIPVSADWKAQDLLMVLVEHHRAGITQLLESATIVEKPEYLRKLAGLANAAGPIGADQISELAIATGLVGKVNHFKHAMKERAREVAEEMNAQRPRSEVALFYCPTGTKNYFYVGDSRVTQVDRTGALNHLTQSGYPKKSPIPGELSEAETMLTQVERNPIDWHGALAGRKAGLYRENGLRLLVTKSPPLLVAQAGEWSTIREFIESRLNYDPALDPHVQKQAQHPKVQAPYFLGYLALAARSFYLEGGKFRPRQALILSGSAGGGKNTLQELITILVGGRQADPFDHMEGSSSFNGELMGAEHWMIADKQRSSKHADREKLKSCIKEACVNRVVRFNGKHQQPLNVELWRLLSISLNDNAECLRVLPSLSEDLADKLMILHVVGRDFHGPGTDYPSYDAWLAQIKSEFPAFLHYLLHEHVIEACLANVRYGVASYRDPEIVSKLQQQSPEGRLVEIIDEYIFKTRPTPWRDTARELWQTIRNAGGEVELEAIKCESPMKMGAYLARLNTGNSDRFSSSTLRGNVRYRIMPPVVAGTENCTPSPGSLVETT